MSARKFSVRLGLAAVAVSGLALTALAPANADTVPGHDSVPGTLTLGTTVIGVGSDTIQWVDDALSAHYDATNPTVGWANYDACVGKDVGGTGANPDGSGFPCGADNTGTKAGVKRDEGVVDPDAAGFALPSGSGDGRTLLRTPTDKLFKSVAYARSSGPINTTDLAAGEIALPFAVDKIVVATNPNGPAPASLSGKQILKIYNGTYTNWNQVGGKNAKIHPYMPKAGSSTLNAFMSFLATLDGQNEAPGTDNDPASHAAASQVWQGQAGAGAVTDGNWNTGSPTASPATAANVEEHDPSVIVKDKQAIEPFSYARAQLANGATKTVRIEGGWSADRELYHVVRGQAISGAASTPFIYGSDGNVLENLFSSEGWVCTNPTALAAIADSGFWPLQHGSKTGNCGVKNANTEDTIDATASNGVDEGAATETNAFYSAGAVHVAVTSDGDTPTGSVQVVVSDPTQPGIPASSAASFHQTVKLDGDGNAVVKIPATVSGKQTVDVAYLPTNFGANSADGGHTALGSSSETITANIPAAGKVATTAKASVKPATLANAKGKAKVTATVKAASGSAKATGTVKVMLGSKVVGSGKLKAGKVTITVKGSSLKKGKNKLVVTYVASGNFKAPAKSPSVIVHRTK